MKEAEYKVGVIGDWDSIVAFRALGLTIAEAGTAEEADRQLNAWAQDGFAVIFLTEALAEAMGGDLARWRLRDLPAVIIIPSSRRKPYLGRKELRAAVSKATGIDLIGQRGKRRESEDNGVTDACVCEDE